MKKLLFFDIDGTLTEEATGIIPESTKKAVAQARANGHICFLNSGRTITIIDDYLKEMVDGIVGALGTYIEYHGEVLLHKSLDKAICKEIMELGLDCNVECYFEGRYGVCALEHSRFEMFQELNESFINRKMPLTFYPKDDLVFDKFCTMEDEVGDYARFDEFVGNYFRKIDRGNSFYEYEQLGYSKATGIDFLCEYFNTTLDNCYVFGDSTNDLPMLEHVKHSVLMENGNPSLRDKVEYVTTLSSVDGIENALKHYELI